MKRLAIFFSLLAVIGAAMLAFTNTAGAAVYDNGGPDYGSATLSDFTAMQEIGDDFILDASANVTLGKFGKTSGGGRTHADMGA